MLKEKTMTRKIHRICNECNEPSYYISDGLCHQCFILLYKPQRYWHKTITYECPVCGKTEKERIPIKDSPRPPNMWDRMEFKLMVDCNCIHKN